MSVSFANARILSIVVFTAVMVAAAATPLATAQINQPVGVNTRGSFVPDPARDARMKRDFLAARAQRDQLMRERSAQANIAQMYDAAELQAAARGDKKGAWLANSNAALARAKQRSAEQQLSSLQTRMNGMRQDLKPIVQRDKLGRAVRQIPQVLDKTQGQMSQMQGGANGRGWKCNAYGTIHADGPSGCSAPEKGGQWVDQ